MISCMSSGSSRDASAVEPTRSQNMTVSWRRSPDEAERAVSGEPARPPVFSDAATSSFCPHPIQYLAPPGLARPHEVQRAASAVPHPMQNLLSSGTTMWQLGHSTDLPPLASRRSASPQAAFEAPLVRSTAPAPRATATCDRLWVATPQEGRMPRQDARASRASALMIEPLAAGIQRQGGRLTSS